LRIRDGLRPPVPCSSDLQALRAFAELGFDGTASGATNMLTTARAALVRIGAMLRALASLLGGVGEALSTWSLGRVVGDVVARVVDDFKRNRATEQRLKQATEDEPKRDR
jgi:hypothetical protein